MSRLQDLHTLQDQSPWLDNLRRDWINDGQLQQWIDRGVRGITSNPSILQKAIQGADVYDEEFGSLVAAGTSVVDSYWQLATSDIEQALALLRPVYDESDGIDGFVSLEVAPELARDTAGSAASARSLHDAIAQPNLYVKIPGTAEGVPAIQQMVAEGRNINITLLFSVKRYGEVIEAYLAGLEQFVADGGDPSHVASVASFFVSRVDSEVDRRLDEIGTPEALALRGKAAVANAQVAYGLFLDRFSGPRWEALAAKGARVQRPLWASTSTKNPNYPETLYVDTLIGPHTVNTMPEATLDAFDARGTVARTVDADLASAQATVDALLALGIDLEEVAAQLEEEGLASFAKSFDELLASLETKAASLRNGG
jgi:transaldolase